MARSLGSGLAMLCSVGDSRPRGVTERGVANARGVGTGGVSKQMRRVFDLRAVGVNDNKGSEEITRSL